MLHGFGYVNIPQQLQVTGDYVLGEFATPQIYVKKNMVVVYNEFGSNPANKITRVEAADGEIKVIISGEHSFYFVNGMKLVCRMENN